MRNETPEPVVKNIHPFASNRAQLFLPQNPRLMCSGPIDSFKAHSLFPRYSVNFASISVGFFLSCRSCPPVSKSTPHLSQPPGNRAAQLPSQFEPKLYLPGRGLRGGREDCGISEQYAPASEYRRSSHLKIRMVQQIKKFRPKL